MSDSAEGITQRSVELERIAAMREILEKAAQKLESRAVGVVYSKAMRTAARLVRELKPD